MLVVTRGSRHTGPRELVGMDVEHLAVSWGWLSGDSFGLLNFTLI